MKSWLSSQNAAREKFLIVGLGNPGSQYEKTRHNAGRRAAEAFAARHGIELRKKGRFEAYFGEGEVKGKWVGVVLPETYMNRSGVAVAAVMKTWKVPLDHVVVVVDEIAFPVGVLRLKEGGSDGGHNGLKSVEDALGTKQYPRLRIGIDHPNGGDLADFVLSSFGEEDEDKLPEVLGRVADGLECWMSQGIQRAMEFINTR